jgi:hypothetical protein
MAVFCVLLLPIQAFAAETRASDQITKYSIDVVPVTNSLTVSFLVSSSSNSAYLGCSSIKIYEKSGNRWLLTSKLDENDSGMAKNNTRSYDNTLFFDSKSGVEYRVVVTVFAENSSGRDTRSKTVYVTGK